MKEQRQIDRDDAWAYAHGELESDRRKQFEQRIAEDADLAAHVEDVKQADAFLREAAAAQQVSLQDVQKCALVRWAQEQGEGDPVVHRSVQSVVPPSPSPSSNIVSWGDLFLNARWLRAAGVAAAFALVFMLLNPFSSNPTVEWGALEYDAPRYRGAVDAAQITDKADADSCFDALRDAVRAELGEKSPARDVVLTFRLQAFDNGAFTVSLRAVDNWGSTVREWTGDYSRTEAFLNQVPRSAKRIAGFLTERPGSQDLQRDGVQ